MNTHAKKITPVILVVVGIWILYTIIYGFLRENPLTINIYGYMPFFFLSALDIVAIVFAIHLSRKATDQYTKKISLLFIIAFCASFFDDILYNLTNNILHLPKESIPSWLPFADNFAFIIDLGCLTLIWIKFFTNFIQHSKNPGKLISSAWILTAVFLIWTILTKWQGISASDKIFNVIEGFLYLTGTMFALFCLIKTKNSVLFYTSLAFCIGRISDFIFSYNLVAQQYDIGSMLETVWVIVLLLYVYGLSRNTPSLVKA